MSPNTATDRPLVKTLRAAGALAVAALLAACSASPQQQTETGASVPVLTGRPPLSPTLSADELLAQIDAAGAERFLCDLSGTVVARLGGYDSFYSSKVDDLGNALSIVTIDGVSYARYQGPLDASASAARRSVVETLGGRWATWGQPDTILLEELPGTPAACLAWYSIDAASLSDIVVLGDGTITFGIGLGDGVVGTGRLTSRSDGAAARLEVSAEGSKVAVVDLGAIPEGVLPEELGADGRVRPGKVAELTQEEYFALVGG